MKSNDAVPLKAAAGTKLTLEERAAVLERIPCMRVARAMLKVLLVDIKSVGQSLAGWGCLSRKKTALIAHDTSELGSSEKDASRGEYVGCFP